MSDRRRRRGVAGRGARRGRSATEPRREVSRVERVSRAGRVDDLTRDDGSDVEDDVLDGDHAWVRAICDDDLPRAHRPERLGDRAGCVSVRQPASIFGRRQQHVDGRHDAFGPRARSVLVRPQRGPMVGVVHDRAARSCMAVA